MRSGWTGRHHRRHAIGAIGRPVYEGLEIQAVLERGRFA
jgi:hypothetical protein